MCKVIAELTGTDEPTTRAILERFERYAALPGVDVRVTGEIFAKAHAKMRELGLDPHDTTPRELYRALINLTALHDSFLAKRLGVANASNPLQISKAVERYFKSTKLPMDALAMKASSAKQILRTLPPKNLMKALGYRSLESMLKRESPLTLLSVARKYEPLQWQQQYAQACRKLSTPDFEQRRIEVKYLHSKQWQPVAEQCGKQLRRNIFHNIETAEIVLLPIPHLKRPGLTLISLLLSFYHINEIRALSTYSKLHHLHPTFGARFAEQVNRNTQHHIRIAGHPTHWNIAHRHFSADKAQAYPEFFDPHVQANDLTFQKAEKTLYQLEPALHFWHELDYVGLPMPGGPLSLSLLDMAINLLSSRPFDRRLAAHLGVALWDELYLRYSHQPVVAAELHDQLEQQLLNQTVSQVPELPNHIIAQLQPSLADLLIIRQPAQPKAYSYKNISRHIALDMELV